MPIEEKGSQDVRHLYTESYFLNEATGHSEFSNFNGGYDQLIDKFRFVLKKLELSPSESLLDIGCGRGELVIYHALQGGNAIGVDFSEDAIRLAEEKAKELGSPCRFITSPFQDIPEIEVYDRIVSLDFIEHISAGEAGIFMRKCHKLLKYGGRLLIFTYPNTFRRRYGYKIIRYFSYLKNKPLPKNETDTLSEHYKEYHLNEQNCLTLKRLALHAGFKDFQITYYDPSVKESFLKKILVGTPFRHLFLKGLTLVAVKSS
jgi:cyclopropane fatty-acyl-phospholipid synthase-like methyltransferase